MGSVTRHEWSQMRRMETERKGHEMGQHRRLGWRQTISFTHMAVQNGGEFHTGHKDVVAHVLLATEGLRGAQVGGYGDGGRTGHIAA